MRVAYLQRLRKGAHSFGADKGLATVKEPQRARKNATIALPIKADLFLRNRRQATAHCVAARLSAGFSTNPHLINADSRVKHRIYQISYQIRYQHHDRDDDGYSLDERNVKD